MEPGKSHGIPKCKDIVVTAEGHNGSQDVSHDVGKQVAVVRLKDPSDHFKQPNLSVNWSPATADDVVSVSSSSTGGHPKAEICQKKQEIEGMGADNVDVPFPLGNKLFYNDLTFDQVQECKLNCHDDMQSVRSPSRMFYACLACTIPRG